MNWRIELRARARRCQRLYVGPTGYYVSGVRKLDVHVPLASGNFELLSLSLSLLVFERYAQFSLAKTAHSRPPGPKGEEYFTGAGKLYRGV